MSRRVKSCSRSAREGSVPLVTLLPATLLTACALVGFLGRGVCRFGARSLPWGCQAVTLEDSPSIDPGAAPGNPPLPVLLPLPSWLPGTRAFCSSCLFPLPSPALSPSHPLGTPRPLPTLTWPPWVPAPSPGREICSSEHASAPLPNQWQ